jgi:hypothetical protein
MDSWRKPKTKSSRISSSSRTAEGSPSSTGKLGIFNNWRELTLKFQADKTALIAENTRLKEVIDLRSQEIEELTQSQQHLEDQNNF